TSFTTDIKGAITKTGPLDAEILFPNPVTVSYSGRTLGTMQMPTVKAIANQGATLDLKAVNFTIADGAAFAEFTTFALNNEKFEWTISATGVVVNAMGASLPGVTMTKTVTLDGFNKLPGLTLSRYEINSVDAQGLHMVISATLANPSTIGMTIPVSQFNTLFHGAVLGPAFAYNMALVPHSSSSFALNATIAADGTDKTLYLQGIFKNALSGVFTPLEAKGVAAPGVSWLDTAIKSLLLSTSLPPLQEAPISSVTIDSMEMDFACGDCTWKPMATSSITADTKLPFANGAPIKQLAQNVQILDKKGQLVGTLNTPYASVTLAGSKVSTNTPPAPLEIAEGSHDIYTTFISDLNTETTYELGLRGTADSILDLGPFGDVEIKGIPLDVKTTMAGLQGLKNIKYMALIDFQQDPPYTMITTSVNIYNPSRLTLNIGDLLLTAGQEGFTLEVTVGTALVKNLRLVPGDNKVVSLLTTSTQTVPGNKFAIDIANRNVTLNMWASSTSTSNPALNAGLSSLRTGVPLPQNLWTDTPLGFSDIWSIKVLPTTVNDGLVEITATFNNPYLMDMKVEGVARQDEGAYTQYPSYMAIYGRSRSFNNFLFPDDFSYAVPSGQSVAVTFKAPLRINGLTQSTVQAYVDGLVAATTTGSAPFDIWLYPRVRLGAYPNLMYPIWTDGFFYPNKMTIKAGPDFPMIRDWFVKNALPDTPDAVPVTPPPVVVPVTPSPSPSDEVPSPSPPLSTVAPSPVAPSTVAPSPVVSPTVAPAA
ncbi:hypothetical protein BGW39_011142, partial [Mortierella sp. 14UC]